MRTFCECDSCKNDLDFKIPDEIIEALLNDRLILFAGAGISTENNIIFKETLYQDIKLELELDDTVNISFPDLMSQFCNTKTNGRQKLLERIKHRFDYCHQFNELYRAASRFHEEIAPIWMLKNIITTNWDDYFERKCNAIPIVVAEDFAFYNIDQRKVFKIHGSISNYSSIVATTEDYEKCFANLNTGLIGAALKTLLATKTVVFVGYSFRDFDFINILNYLKKELKEVLPHIYIVTLDDNLDSRIEEFKNTVIKTDGRYFFSQIKKHLEAQKIVIPKENLDRIYEVEYLRQSTHELVTNDFQNNRIPTLIFCAFYQDGVQHAIDYLKFREKSGESFNPMQIIQAIESYTEHLRKELTKAKNYTDLAYIDGYINGLSVPLYDEFKTEDFPLFYIFGIGATNDTTLFKETVSENIIYHKSAEKYGQKYFKDILKKGNEMVMHHRPFF
jgi:hypothetical protein